MPFVQVLLDAVPFWQHAGGADRVGRDRLALPVPGLDRFRRRRPGGSPRRASPACASSSGSSARAPRSRWSATAWTARAAADAACRRRLVRRRGLDRRPALQRPARSDRVGRVRARRDRAVPARVPDACSPGSCCRCEPSGRCRSRPTRRSSWSGRSWPPRCSATRAISRGFRDLSPVLADRRSGPWWSRARRGPCSIGRGPLEWVVDRMWSRPDGAASIG